jgi:hypothetical protein
MVLPERFYGLEFAYHGLRDTRNDRSSPSALMLEDCLFVSEPMSDLGCWRDVLIILLDASCSRARLPKSC